MKRHGLLKPIIFVLNTVGLLGFFGWLVYSRERIFYTQDGVLFFLPCLPFFFVYIFLFRGARPAEDIDPY